MLSRNRKYILLITTYLVCFLAIFTNAKVEVYTALADQQKASSREALQNQGRRVDQESLTLARRESGDRSHQRRVRGNPEPCPGELCRSGAFEGIEVSHMTAVSPAVLLDNHVSTSLTTVWI